MYNEQSIFQMYEFSCKINVNDSYIIKFMMWPTDLWLCWDVCFTLMLAHLIWTWFLTHCITNLELTDRGSASELLEWHCFLSNQKFAVAIQYQVSWASLIIWCSPGHSIVAITVFTNINLSRLTQIKQILFKLLTSSTYIQVYV